MRTIDVHGYLTRLGLDDIPGPPSSELLFALHRAHVERVAYEGLHAQFGDPASIDPTASVERIAAGRGGYCFHLNGAFAALLEHLGFHVTRHAGGVQPRFEDPPGVLGNHLALTVRVDARDWFVDVGLGDGIYEPLPLRAGVYDQGPFSYALAPSDVVPGGWRFTHDPRGSFPRMDFARETTEMDAFAEKHEWLSTSPESSFVRTCAILRRDAKGTDSLTGCALRRIDASGETTTYLTTERDWYAAVADVFGLPLTDLTPEDRHKLWDRVHATHLDWEAARAARTTERERATQGTDNR
ncbi:arylamine N-acetyltransferase family protein [Yinghuangia seranimata]|uniref:arylamine N-acetyltransferase family protein n=1 Tax=Yinghuangia seranimata TaxID=408067 RepID=UPI00248C1B2F|nr:arylamine N-acetyltransferase [Yinghuangia seranimata]MDI2126925.1 arylamine N-acetyltransferase [Yinghuangia seranimata]